MQLFLNKKLESIFILKQLDTLIKDRFNEFALEDINSVDLVSKILDPVQEFIDYWISDTGAEMDEGRKSYIKNSLYAAKGAPEVLKAFERGFEVQIEFEYEFPVLDIISIDIMIISDVHLFVNKFRNLIYHLLYYTELNLYIKNLILSLKGELVEFNSIMIKNYSIVLTNWNQNDTF